ncbi:CHAT domain-containing protein [Crenobacter sp. SG2303]|uniref:CHAT domain-containing protein n=1 Tax=Crenobacter oryzisoli TaxID=3056844 RepID=A0ABT7XMT4_9NEIS|nr:CHAT domain-containing tetratricopeptide repeat protein [Crenobacter sp. SG2303]MDN0075109.1 CHAT domain-containing protein [Crenobacter sp. SG2303]
MLLSSLCLMLAISPYANGGNGLGMQVSAMGAQVTQSMLIEDFATAETIARDRVAISLGTDHLGDGYRNLGAVLVGRGKWVEAEVVLRQALPLVERKHGVNNRQPIGVLKHLAKLMIQEGRYQEAQSLIAEGLRRQQAYAPDRVSMLQLYDLQASVLHILRQDNEALAVLDKADALKVAAEPVDPHDNGSGPEWVAKARAHSLFLRGQCQEGLGKTGEAENLYQSALAGYRQLQGAKDANTSIQILSALGMLYLREKRNQEAVSTLRQARQMAEAVLGPYHPLTARSGVNLARALEQSGQDAEAESLYRPGVEQLSRLNALNALSQDGLLYGRFLAHRGRLEEALKVYQLTLDAIDKQFAQTRGLEESVRESFVAHFNTNFVETIQVLLRLHAQHPEAGYDRQILEVISRTQSRLFSELLKQADVAKLSNDRAFQILHKQQQQLQNQLAELRRERTNTGAFNESVGETSSDANDVSKDQQIQQRINANRKSLDDDIRQTQQQLTVVSQQLWQQFPRFMDMAEPKPVNIKDLQQHVLRRGEALLTYFLMDKETLAFVTTPDSFHLIRLPLGRDKVAALVTALRAPEENAADSLGSLKALNPALLHSAYQQLFQPLEGFLKPGTRLLSIGDGPLHTLPLEMLVTQWTEQDQQQFAAARQQSPLLGEYAGLHYLADRFQIAYLPSLSALVSMRQYRKPRVQYAQQLVSFADPVFEQSEPSSPGSLLGQSIARNYGKSKVGLKIPRLPETAVEAQGIANILGDRNTLYLEGNAQEYTLKHLDLTSTRYLHFATHGLLGGEFVMLKEAMGEDASSANKVRPEPALLLSLTGNLHGEDGLLTMHEVVENLNLNAELVVLSACNTAGEHDAAHSGEGFAGLARAFMYAGAQGLLVSHWSVESQATQELMVATFSKLKSGSSPTSAIEAARRELKQSQFLSGGQAMSRAHPFFWAPFVYVGD